MPSPHSTDPRVHEQWKPPAVLLVDADANRRTERAASMRRAGVVVHCATNGTSAAALWEPEKYQLVLIELFEAEADVRPFCAQLQSASRQKIGIYRSTHPFIVPPGGDLRIWASAMSREAPRPVGKRLQDELVVLDRRLNWKPGLLQAAQRIAALRQRTPDAAEMSGPPPVPPPARPESLASIAARVLGGGA